MNKSKLINNLVKNVDTSFFVYDLDFLHLHAMKLQTIARLHGIKLWYALKANPNKQILEVLKNANFGFDVASIGELRRAVEVAGKDSSILATGPSKSKEYIYQLLQKGVDTIVIESENQLIWLNELLSIHKYNPKVLLRVQLDWSEGSSVLGGDEVTPFGLGFEDWAEIDFPLFNKINFCGFHIFQWGNILCEDKLYEIWKKSFQMAFELSQKTKISFKIMDVGGGLGINYHNQSGSLDFANLMLRLAELKNRYQLEQVWMELGRYCVAESGQYLTKIIDVKKVRGHDMIVIEGGINHLARPALTQEYFPCSALTLKDSSQKNYRIHGPLCTALDFHGIHQLPNDLTCGDWLVFDKVGAYGFTEAMPYFLSHPKASEFSYQSEKLVKSSAVLEI